MGWNSLVWMRRIGLGLALGGLGGAQTLSEVRGAARDRLGSGLHAIGDFDGDGTPDLLVGADQKGKGSALPGFTRGLVELRSGRDGRVLLRVTGDDYLAQTGQAPGAGFGVEAILAGDLDGDGVGDVLVAHGNPKALRKVAAFSGASGAFLFELVDPHGHTDFGSPMLPLGDVLDPAGNPGPDGTPDFAIGAPVNPVSQGISTYPGRVYFYSGATPLNGPVLTSFGAFPRIAYGHSLTLVDDLDGDGIPALAVSALAGNYVDILDGPSFTSVLVLNSPFLGGGYGAHLAYLGDLDGDRRGELAVGAPAARGGEGRVVVYTLDPAGAIELARLAPPTRTPGLGFGTTIAGLPVDPATSRGLLDLDHDGQPDPFLDWNHDGVPDLVVGANGFRAPGDVRAGGVYLLRGVLGGQTELDRAIHQGPAALRGFSFLAGSVAREGETLWDRDRVLLLGNALGESQPLLALATPNDEDQAGQLALLRPAFAHFDDDTFSRASDGVGTRRELRLDFGPAHAGRTYYVIGSTAGAQPGLPFQGFTLPVNDDGPGGLLQRMATLQPGGTPLAFSHVTGTLDGSGRATIGIVVSAPTAGHPWFAVPRHDYVAVLAHPTRPARLGLVGAPTALHIE
jgi:FG-GAP repeat